MAVGDKYFFIGDRMVAVESVMPIIGSKVVCMQHNGGILHPDCVSVGSKVVIIPTKSCRVGVPAITISAEIDVSFSFRVNYWAPNYAYDVLARANVSDGSQWVWTFYLLGDDCAPNTPHEMFVSGYDGVELRRFSGNSYPLSLGVDYTARWVHYATEADKFYINGVMQGSPVYVTLLPHLASTIHYGDVIYNGAGRPHNAANTGGVTMWDVSITQNI